MSRRLSELYSQNTPGKAIDRGKRTTNNPSIGWFLRRIIGGGCWQPRCNGDRYFRRLFRAFFGHSELILTAQLARVSSPFGATEGRECRHSWARQVAGKGVSEGRKLQNERREGSHRMAESDVELIYFISPSRHCQPPKTKLGREPNDGLFVVVTVICFAEHSRCRLSSKSSTQGRHQHS